MIVYDIGIDYVMYDGEIIILKWKSIDNEVHIFTFLEINTEQQYPINVESSVRLVKSL